MATFFMFGKYSSDALKGVSAERTRKTAEIFKKLGGELKSIHALLGDRDLVIIAEFPGVSQVMKASVILHKMTGISFVSSPAVTVEEFDKIMAEL
jgi:uncharacterized protein with GYD domain